MENIVITSSLF